MGEMQERGCVDCGSETGLTCLMHIHQRYKGASLLIGSTDRVSSRLTISTPHQTHPSHSHTIHSLPHPPHPPSPLSPQPSRASQRSSHRLTLRWVWFLLTWLVVPITRAHFYATEAEGHRYGLFYFRKHQWAQMRRVVIVSSDGLTW